MSDRRPRSQRPRNRGGKNRFADVAATRRQNRHISALQEALEPRAKALEETVDRSEIVDHIRSEAVELASQRLEGDVSEVVEAALDEIFGLGPLEPVLRAGEVRVVRIRGEELFAGERPARGFRDNDHARAVIERILRSVGKELSEESVTAEMMDGSIVEARVSEGVVQAVIRRP